MRKETGCTIQKYAPEWTKETKPKLAAHQPYGCLTSSNTALFDVNGGGGDLRLLAAVGQRVLVVAYTHHEDNFTYRIQIVDQFPNSML